jgi:hypothetical protein
VLSTLLGTSVAAEEDVEGTEASLPANQAGGADEGTDFVGTLSILLDQGPDGSLKLKVYEPGTAPLIEPDRDILPMGGLIVVAVVAVGRDCNCCVENISPIPFPTEVVGDMGMTEPDSEPADRE